MRNRIERLFKCLKKRTVVFHHKLSARKHVQNIMNFKPFLNHLLTSYYEAARTGGV